MSTTALEATGVYFIEDLCRVLHVSRRTIQRLRRYGAFPIPELSALDKRPRWSGRDVLAYLERQDQLKRGWKRSA